MPWWTIAAALLVAAEPVRFQRHDIDSFPAGYQVAVADINRDGRPDVIALSTEADRVDWYANPDWKKNPVATTAKNIDLAPRDLDGDGYPEMAVASGFYFAESDRGGEIRLLGRPERQGGLWPSRPIFVDPVVHRLRWGDLDGDGRPELIHAPLFSRGSRGTVDPKPAHLWAFRRPDRLDATTWRPWKIDETLTVLHGLHVADLDGDGRDEILTASFEGIYRFDCEGQGNASSWRKVLISTGAPPQGQEPGASRGTSEIAPGSLAPGTKMLAAIEPWHGHQAVVYLPPEQGDLWQRHVLDDTLQEGHAVAVADFDADGSDEIVVGWRAGGGGLRMFDPVDAAGPSFAKVELDRQIAIEGAVVADINLDGRPDLVVIAGRTNNLAWYENLGR